jgi:heme/copper-type cytochrome/quinol oxidase subunit 2
MLKTSRIKLMDFFKRIVNSVRKFIILMMSYTLQIVSVTITVLIASLIVIAVLLYTIIKKSQKEYNENDNPTGAD